MTAITDNLAAIIAHLEHAEQQALETAEPGHAEAVKKFLREEESLAPYRSGALAESLHATPIVRSGDALESTIEPGPEIFYAKYLIPRGGRLDFPTRTVEARPDIPVTMGAKIAQSIADLYNGDT